MIRKPEMNEISQCAELIYVSGPHLFSYIYGAAEPEIYPMIEILCSHPSTTFSKENSLVYLEEGNLAGLIVALPVSELRKATLREFSCYFQFNKSRIQSVLYIMKLIYRLKMAWYYPKLNQDEYFISNIAVNEKFRGRGIASQLMAEIENKAREQSLKKLSLYVETDNTIAQKVYEKYGFYVETTSMLPSKYNRHGLEGFSKMVKDI